MLDLAYSDSLSVLRNQKGRYMMQNFVVAGKAKTVFRLVELMAKGKQAEKAEIKKK